MKYRKCKMIVPSFGALLIALTGVSTSSLAAPAGQADLAGIILHYVIDTESDNVNFALESMTTTPPAGCSGSSFTLPGSLQQSPRYSAMLSSLMTAHATNAPITVRYKNNDITECTLANNGVYYLTILKVWFQ